MSSIKGLEKIASSLSRIEDDNVLVLSQMNQMLKALSGPLLHMNFAAHTATRIHYSYHEQDEQRNKDTELLAERKKLIASTIGAEAAKLLEADEPYLQDRYRPGAQPVKLSKTH